MPTVSAAPIADDARHDSPSVPLTVAVAASVLSLAAVVGGFVLVALTLIGVSAVPLGWGAGLCIGGWALAAVVRERTRVRTDARPSTSTN